MAVDIVSAQTETDGAAAVSLQAGKYRRTPPLARPACAKLVRQAAERSVGNLYAAFPPPSLSSAAAIAAHSSSSEALQTGLRARRYQ
jgi:hypothetical protein